MKSVISSRATQAPRMNFMITMMISTEPVRTLPKPLIAALSFQCGPFRLRQCVNMPNWLRKKEMNTPLAYSGSSRCWLPRKMNTRREAIPNRKRMPLEKFRREPRLTSCLGR